MDGDLRLRFVLPREQALGVSLVVRQLVDVWHDGRRLFCRAEKVTIDSRDPERCKVTLELKRVIA